MYAVKPCLWICVNTRLTWCQCSIYTDPQTANGDERILHKGAINAGLSGSTV